MMHSLFKNKPVSVDTYDTIGTYDTYDSTIVDEYNEFRITTDE